MRLTDFRVLSFDCYGTLIDWESGLLTALQPLLARAGGISPVIVLEAFAESAAALRYLKRHYRLVILSNVDRSGFAASCRRLGVTFEAVCTAQDIGSYKPDPANFRYLLDRVAALGHGRNAILHTAQSLFHDHAPAQRCGLATAWIDRRQDRPGWGATMAPPEDAVWNFRFASLQAMAEAHRVAAGG